MEFPAFKYYCEEIVFYSLGTGYNWMWKYVGNTKILTMRKLQQIPNSLLPMRGTVIFDYHIVYNSVMKLPAIFLSIFNTDGERLNYLSAMNILEQCLPPDIELNREVITLAMHPYNSQACLTLEYHLLNQQAAFEKRFRTTKNPVYSFIKTYGPYLNLV